MQLSVILIITLTFVFNIDLLCGQYMSGFPSYYPGYANYMNKAKMYNCSQKYAKRTKSALAQKAEDILSTFQPHQVKQFKPYQSKIEALVNSPSLPSNFYKFIQSLVSTPGILDTDKMPDFKTIFENYKKDHNQSLSFNTLIQLQLKEPSVFNLLTAPRHYVVNNLRNVMKYVDRTVRNKSCSDSVNCANAKQDIDSKTNEASEPAPKPEPSKANYNFKVTTTAPAIRSTIAIARPTERLNPTFDVEEPLEMENSFEPIPISNEVEYAVPFDDEAPILNVSNEQLLPELVEQPDFAPEGPAVGELENFYDQQTIVGETTLEIPFEDTPPAPIPPNFFDQPTEQFNRFLTDEIKTEKDVDRKDDKTDFDENDTEKILVEKAIESQIIDKLDEGIKSETTENIQIDTTTYGTTQTSLDNEESSTNPSIFNNLTADYANESADQTINRDISPLNLNLNDLSKPTIENTQAPNMINEGINLEKNELVNEATEPNLMISEYNENKSDIFELHEDLPDDEQKDANSLNTDLIAAAPKEINFQTDATLIDFTNENAFIELGEAVNDRSKLYQRELIVGNRQPKQILYGTDVMPDNF